tara:strand:+ start:48 stop:194 length:147 start_codon:yes stop_codon:yes gene_type:complete
MGFSFGVIGISNNGFDRGVSFRKAFKGDMVLMHEIIQIITYYLNYSIF